MTVSPNDTLPAGAELRPEYDFRSLRGVVRGMSAARCWKRLRAVRLSADAAGAATDGAAEPPRPDVSDELQL